jgi:hypothetical protein
VYVKTSELKVGKVYVVRVSDFKAPCKLLGTKKKKTGEGRGRWFFIQNILTGYKMKRRGPQSFLYPCDATCIEGRRQAYRELNAYRGGEHVAPRAHLIEDY